MKRYSYMMATTLTLRTWNDQ